MIAGHLKKRTIVLVLIALCSLCTVLLAEAPSIEVQYPRKGQSLPAVDSNFIFGRVTPGSQLKINGIEVPVHSEGGFLAFIDVDPGEFLYHLEAEKDGESISVDWPVEIADRYRAVPRDSLAILDTYQNPWADQELIPGDLIEVTFRGTPGGIASFTIRGLARDWPMTESDQMYESMWGNEVFGSGAVEDSSSVAGIYRGSMYVPAGAQVDSAQVIFRLKVSAKQLDSRNVKKGTVITKDLGGTYYILEDTARGRVTVKQHEFPQVVELIDSVQTIRTGPRKGYLSIFQPRGVRFVYEGSYGNYARMKLAPGQPAWVPDSSIAFLPPGTPVPHSYIRSIRCTESLDLVRIQVYLDQKLPYQVEELPEDNRFVLRVFQATSDTDWIRYLGSREMVKLITWSQEQAGVYRLTIEMEKLNVWGWEGYYEGNVLTLDIQPSPKEFRHYHDLRIMIDPGHSGDPGAIGPTGLTEAEANLMIADKLAAVLRKTGATVFMTRVDSSDVKLYERPAMAVEKDCDVFISVHNNSVPDGVNPFYANGVSTYYYNAHSKPLADRVQDRLLQRLGLNDHGLYYANFAVTRPTQYLAILVECAFIIIPEQEAELRADEFQMKCANAIAEGLDDYLESLNER